MHTWTEITYLPGWVNTLKPYGVFFSEPLDLDLMMLRTFPDAYAATIPAGGGPRSTLDKAAEAVLGTAGPGLKHYVGPYDKGADLLPAYRYHFLTKSKPATHLAALPHIAPKDLKAKMPPILAEVLEHVGKSLRRD
jgi:putative ATP-dependent endonuclease of OLD family